ESVERNKPMKSFYVCRSAVRPRHGCQVLEPFFSIDQSSLPCLSFTQSSKNPSELSENEEEVDPSIPVGSSDRLASPASSDIDKRSCAADGLSAFRRRSIGQIGRNNHRCQDVRHTSKHSRGRRQL